MEKARLVNSAYIGKPTTDGHDVDKEHRAFVRVLWSSSQSESIARGAAGYSSSVIVG